jgi:hypothetical protein
LAELPLKFRDPVTRPDLGPRRFRYPLDREGKTMSNKAAVSLTTGLEDAERVTVALLVAVGAAEGGRPTVMFLTKESRPYRAERRRRRHRLRGLPGHSRPHEAL